MFQKRLITYKPIPYINVPIINNIVFSYFNVCIGKKFIILVLRILIDNNVNIAINKNIF